MKIGVSISIAKIESMKVRKNENARYEIRKVAAWSTQNSAISMPVGMVWQKVFEESWRPLITNDPTNGAVNIKSEFSPRLWGIERLM
ncbi:hypothetical protein [Marinobacter salsuginis]|uniref:Uncharacterized protein n=1 Tax=Marinobacter salsuginis TaxID=418719 RepID=A0A5M3Q5N9_9GAMM|nr:hypothetical protein [Marinobacter salsuginis]GBO90593.1 hypothetical protein MSSD14B_42610 [Marinobacter salsuginis]